MASKSNELPLDIMIEEVFTRLPVKSLVRFTSVCKLWRHTIKTKEFITTTLRRNRSNPDTNYLLFLNEKGRGNYVTMFSGQIALLEYCNFQLPFKVEDIMSTSSCHGLVLIQIWNTCGLDGAVFLWNPSIRKLRNIDYRDPHVSGYSSKDCFYYLGYDDLHNDHKVLKMVFNINRRRKTIEFLDEIYVYSLRTNSWTRRRRSFANLRRDLIPDCKRRRGGAHVNGATHFGKLTNKLELLNDAFGDILLFDFKEFKEMKLPAHVPSSFVALENFDGFLALVMDRVNTVNGMINLWIMHEYGNPESWTKHTIKLWDNCWVEYQFINDGNLIIETDYGKEGPNYYLVILDLEKQQVKCHKKIGCALFSRIIDFADSLILLE